MKIGMSWWGFLADQKWTNGRQVSTPDGTAFYQWSIISMLRKADCEVYRMMPDRDYEYVMLNGRNAFSMFAEEDRYSAYTYINQKPGELDAVLLEWRFPIPGRNCDVDKSSPAYQPDLDIQNAIIEKYPGKIIVFDLDYKFTKEDYDRVKPLAVLETGYKTDDGVPRIHVEIPFDFDHINTFSVRPSLYDVAYVGNRYERDYAVDEYLNPMAHRGYDVRCWGNWLEGGRESDKDWPLIKFGPRITMSDFRKAYGWASLTPLLAKDDYCKYGFMTARIIEACFFGAVPVGMANFKGIERYLPDHLIASNADDLEEIIYMNENVRTKEKNIMQTRRHLSTFMDARFFVCKLLSLL
jgi:hypothetical protein